MNAIVVLDRIEPGETPEYCVHGRCTCVGCDEWCWLGDETVKVVYGGEALPLCMQCAKDKFTPADPRPYRRVHDHRRADGPH